MSQAPIGIFGGTFDPIHHGHLRIALDLQETLQLQQVRFLPSASPPHRDKPLRSAEQRAALVEAAIAGQAGFVLDGREMQRGGPSYMVDTLLDLRAELGAEQPLCLLMGADAFAGLPRWHRWEALLDLTHIVVAGRPGDHPQAADFPNGWLDQHQLNSAERLKQSPHGGLWQQPVTQLDISASDIRARLASGRSARYLVPDRVMELLRSQAARTE